MRLPHAPTQTHITRDVLTKLSQLQQAHRVQKRYLPDLVWQLNPSLSSPHFENSLAHIILALFEAQIPIWQTDAYDTVGELIHTASTAPQGGTLLKVEKALLLHAWWELQALTSWIFKEAQAWHPIGGSLDNFAPKLDCAYVAKRVEAFLAKVHADLFPVDTELFDASDPETFLWVLREIPVTPLGYTTDPELDCPSNYAEPIQTLLTLMGYEHGYGDADSLDSDERVPLQMPKIPVSDLADTIRQMHGLPEVIQMGLPTLIESMARNTGNIWLDCSYTDIAMGEVGLEGWQPTTVRFYAEQWLEAAPLFDSTLTLVDWVSADAEKRLNQIQQLLITARIMKDKERGYE